VRDVTCRRCGHAWDPRYLADEALWDHPGEHAPPWLLAAYERLVALEDDAYEATGEGIADSDHAALGGRELELAVLQGEGCPGCWRAPSRAGQSPAKRLPGSRTGRGGAAGWSQDRRRRM
jgi:hypothetical protein